MKLTCLNCNHVFQGNVSYDNLGWHSSCPKCGASFDVDLPGFSIDNYYLLSLDTSVKEPNCNKYTAYDIYGPISSLKELWAEFKNHIAPLVLGMYCYVLQGREVIVEGECGGNLDDKLHDYIVNLDTLNYQFLSRLQGDCKYYLGAGGRKEKHLWAKDVDGQIALMKKTYDNIAVKPEWISMEDINAFETEMKRDPEKSTWTIPVEYSVQAVVHVEAKSIEEAIMNAWCSSVKDAIDPCYISETWRIPCEDDPDYIIRTYNTWDTEERKSE